MIRIDTPHLSAEEIPGVAGSPPDDARRVHLAGCPRCQALAANFESFMQPAASLPEMERKEALARLAAVLEAHAAATPANPPGSRARARGFDWFAGRGRWALAAGIAAVVIALAGRELRPGRDELRLRNAPGEAAEQRIALEGVIRLAGGGLSVQWKPFSGAEAYEVRFYDADLKEAARRGPLAQCALTIPPADPVLQPGTAGGFLRVVALRGDAPVAMSAPQPLPAR